MRKLRLLKQKPYCCVPVCLAMILDRRIIRHDSQEKIGNDLGLIVPPESAKYFKKVRTGRRPAAGFGTQIQKKEFSINHFFIKYKISLREKYYLPKSIGDALAFMSSNLKSGGDIIMCFNHKTVYGKGDWGHAAVVQKVKLGKVTLYDPAHGIKHSKIAKLFTAMLSHGKRKRGGLWLIYDLDSK